MENYIKDFIILILPIMILVKRKNAVFQLMNQNITDYLIEFILQHLIINIKITYVIRFILKIFELLNFFYIIFLLSLYHRL